MPALTLKNIPEPLYRELRQIAKLHHRSLSSEILDCLERSLICVHVSIEERLERARTLRSKTANYPITMKVLNQAKSMGRP